MTEHGRSLMSTQVSKGIEGTAEGAELDGPALFNG